MVITRKTFSGQVIAAMAGQGLPPEAPIMHEWPTDMWLTGADLTPLREGIDYIVEGLTKWESKVKETGLIGAGEKVTVEGEDYEDALTNMNHLFLTRLWGDGLPIMPPVDERVDWILTGTDLPRDSLVGQGKILPRGGISSVESLAVSLAMAGGRPEELPVLIATVEAMTVPEARHESWIATTRSCFPVVIVNGPVGQQVRLTSRYGVLGPDPRFPGSSTIGRALSFLIRILGGAIPGAGTMAIYGFMRHANAVFAEDEAGLALSDWPSLAEERGYAKGTNVVTVYPAVTAHQTQLHQAFGPSVEEEEIQFLRRIGGDLGAPGLIGGYVADTPGRTSGMVLIAYNMVKVLSELGWSKERVKEFIKENATPTWEMLVKYGRVDPAATSEPIEIAPPVLVIAGGDQSNQACLLWDYGHRSGPTSAEVKLPANWDALLAQAEKDLGPIPVF
jgi:hypothetical protein